ncbi:MAG: ABC transporter ATP-binding protein [Burkholderiaceae bacterium]
MRMCPPEAMPLESFEPLESFAPRSSASRERAAECAVARPVSQGGLAFERVSLRLGAFALRDVSLSVAPGEILAVLGPNGAGKSVLLETIAGFHRPDAGRILLDGADMTAAAPERRRIGFVFQNYALFPHLSVAQNVRFALDRLRPRDAGTGERVAGLLARFGLAALANRRPDALSGGERQRVALARAMASEPSLFLFDEPFAAVDERSRAVMAEEIRETLRESGVPAIFVLHDLDESAALADRIAVIRDGRLEQTGSPDDILNRPANAFVAQFAGVENLLDGTVVGGGRTGDVVVEAGGLRLRAAASADALAKGQRVRICVRPEHVEFPGQGDAGAEGDGNILSARIAAMRPSGALVKLAFDAPLPLVACIMRRQAEASSMAIGKTIRIRLPADALHLLPGRD